MEVTAIEATCHPRSPLLRVPGQLHARSLWHQYGSSSQLPRKRKEPLLTGEGFAALWAVYLLQYPLFLAEQNVERQVLRTQCRRLEAQHYSLSVTAERLSHSMAVRLSRERGPWTRVQEGEEVT